MNVDGVTKLIKIPLDLIKFVLDNIIIILILIGLGYFVYWVNKNKKKIVGFIKKEKEPKKEYYFDRLIKGG